MIERISRQWSPFCNWLARRYFGNPRRESFSTQIDEQQHRVVLEALAELSPADYITYGLVVGRADGKHEPTDSYIDRNLENLLYSGQITEDYADHIIRLIAAVNRNIAFKLGLINQKQGENENAD